MKLFRTLLVAGLALAAWAQGFDPAKDVGLRFRKGAVELQVPDKTHLKAAFMKVEKKGGPGTLTVGPLPKTDGVDELGDPVWHGLVRLPLRGTGLKGHVLLSVTYQPCTEGEGGVCFPPTTRELKVLAHEVPLFREEKATAGQSPAATLVKSPPPAHAPSPAPPPAPVAKPEASTRGTLLTLLLVFLGGFLASLTPCVLPMIPITLAIIGAKGGGWRRGLPLSLALVAGMAVTYVTLGILAAKLGAQAVSFTQRPVFLVPVAVIFTGFALSLFGLFEIALPPTLAAKLQDSSAKKGYRGAFMMGLVLGPLSAPCVGPIVGTVLLAIAAKGQVAMGALQLLLFSLGMGTMFIAVGTFGASLFRSGDWQTRFKQLLGVVILGFAAWTIRLIVPPALYMAMGFVVLLITSVVLGVFEPAPGLLLGLRKGIAVLVLACGTLLGVRSVATALDLPLVPTAPMASTEAKPKLAGWMENDYEGALAKAKKENKVVVIDLFAEWCAQCHELDEKTWPDPAVRQWLGDKAVALRLDTDAKRPDLAGPLKVLGYPTIIVLDAEGRELRRIQGFHKPEAMLAFLEGRS